MDDGRADIRFVDRTRVFLAENTLVVIFGTAGQTRVSRTPAARVRLEEGEVETGLAALRGEPVEVDVQGGGSVRASSRSTVVKKKVARTTVSVFDGSASVRSGGSKVDVPEKMGTSFVRAKPPTPPRPLPPAPAWVLPTPDAVVLTNGGEGVLRVSWSEVPKTQVYRLEVARDAEFSDLVVREEVPKAIHAFRAEKIPTGAYYVRVRSIDEEDFVGLAAPTRQVVLLSVQTRAGRLGGVHDHHLVVNPYGILRFEPDPRLEMALDDGPFAPVLPSLDLRMQAPKRVRLRLQGSSQVQDVPVEYADVGATVHIGSETKEGEVPVRVALQGFEGIDIAKRVAPSLRVHRGNETVVVALTPSRDGEGTGPAGTAPAGTGSAGTGSAGTGERFEANVAVRREERRLRVDVVDARGRVLGSEMIGLPREPARPASSKRPAPPGIAAAPVPLAEGVSVAWWGPGATSSAWLGGSLALRGGGSVEQVHAAAVGRMGSFALDTRLASNALGDDRGTDGAAWAGLRWTLLAPLPEGRVGVEPSVRVGIPMAASGPSTRVEPAIAIGSLAGRWTWSLDLGIRQRLEDSAVRARTPATHAFLLMGGTLDATDSMRLYGVIDGHLLDDAGLVGRTGLGVGLETKGAVFGSVGLRACPWEDAGGFASGHVSVGVRDE